MRAYIKATLQWYTMRDGDYAQGRSTEGQP